MRCSMVRASLEEPVTITLKILVGKRRINALKCEIGHSRALPFENGCTIKLNLSDCKKVFIFEETVEAPHNPTYFAKFSKLSSMLKDSGSSSFVFNCASCRVDCAREKFTR